MKKYFLLLFCDMYRLPRPARNSLLYGIRPVHLKLLETSMP